MKLKRILENLTQPTGMNAIPQGIIDEGRIFALGTISNPEQDHERVIQVVEGLREHVGQPFEQHAWCFTVNLSTTHLDDRNSPLSVVEKVIPQKDGSILVTQYFAMPRRLMALSHFIFKHTSSGTKISLPKSVEHENIVPENIKISFYPLAIALLNTRGCRVDLKRAPSITNAKRTRQGKAPIPAHYDIEVSEYLTALRSNVESNDRGGGHSSPIPHLRRAHERVLASGKRIWVSSALINVRSEGDIAFVERRKAYQQSE